MDGLTAKVIARVDMYNVRVVILNWNGRRHLERFLPSVVANSPKWAQIVVVDNGSDDDSCSFLAQNFPHPVVTTVRLDKNYGYAGGYNRALAHEAIRGAEYYILLNSDVETPQGWCEPLIDRLERSPKMAAVAPKILDYTNRDMFEYAGASGGFIDGLGYPFCRGRILSKLEQDRGQYDNFRTVFWASGACLVLRAELFEKLGGFDEEFFAHMEEIDLCWRAQLVGYQIGVEPLSSVYHLGAGTLTADNPRKTYLNFRNNLAMLYKNLTKRSLFPVMFVRMVLDGVAAIGYLLTLRPALFKAVWRAHIDFYHWRPDLKQRRKEIQSRRTAPTTNIYRGSIVLRYLFGKKRFGELL